MHETMSRVEVEDLFRHLTTKADRAQHQAACAMEEAKCLRRALVIASWQIRQLTTWLVPLLSVEQQEVIGVEKRAGVTDEPLVTDDVVEANDGYEWRSRLRRRGLADCIHSDSAAVETVVLTEREMAAYKVLGSLLVVAPGEDGPCYDRDSAPLVEGLNDGEV